MITTLGLYSLSGKTSVRRLTARSREVSKPRDSSLNFSIRSEIWQVPRQRCCRGACQISERYDHCNIQSRGFETSRDMMTSSNGNIFRVTGLLCGEFTGPGEFPTQRPVTRSFDVFFDVRLNKRLRKQPRGW